MPGLIGERSPSTARFDISAALVLLTLLVLPALALFRLRLTLDPLWPTGAIAAMSLATYCAYSTDLKRARTKIWRISENTLHLLEFFGGWPGAFVAQRHLRHKAVKIRFQITFWFIVLIYQYVALDLLLGWSMSAAVYAWANGLMRSGF